LKETTWSEEMDELDSMGPAELSVLNSTMSGSTWSTKTLTGDEESTSDFRKGRSSVQEKEEIRKILSEVFQPLQAGCVVSSTDGACGMMFSWQLCRQP
jgi:hypothetical protein